MNDCGSIPVHPHSPDQLAMGTSGMTYREWLIGMALQGLCADIASDEFSELAGVACDLADATITEIQERGQ